MRQHQHSIAYAAFAASGLVALLSGCGGEQAAAKSQDRSATAMSVAVARATRQDLARELELSAEFRPFQEIELHAKVSGYLKTISVDVGDFVRAGQTIAVLEVPEMDQDLAQATSTIKRTELEVQRARGDLSRAESNVQIRKLSHDRLASVVKSRPNLIAQQEVDDSEAKLRDAEAQLMAARASLAAAEEQVHVVTANRTRVNTMLAYLKITAPFAGMITERRGDPGALVQAGTASQTQAMPVVRLSQVDHLRLVLPVPESIVPRIKIGSPVEVRVDSLNRVVQGRVARFNGRLDKATRTMETEVDMPNPGYAIKPGMYGTASLRLERRENAIAVPVQAAGAQGAGGTLLVVNSAGTLEDRRVEIGMETPTLVEVKSGLKEGELVVIGSRSRLKPGMKVEPKLVDGAARERAH